MSDRTEIAATGPFQKKVIQVTAAQILASFTTPVVLLAGITGAVIIPRQILFNYKSGGVAYAFTAATDIWWTNLATFNGTSIANIGANIFTQLTNQLFIALCAATAFFWNGVSANVIGQGIVWKTQTANPTLGNGTLTITIEYEVITGVV